MQVVLEDEQYDSMLFLNNDLTVHPYNFVRSLRNGMYPDPWFPANPPVLQNFDVVSPCFYNVEPDGQCHWKTMHNWGSKAPREVPFIDFQCPLISRRLLEDISQIDADLMWGWGIDTLFAITCKQKGYKMAVIDYLSVLHHNSMTLKTGAAGITMADYCKNAEIGQYNFFSKSNLLKEFHEVRNAGAHYSFNQ
jgi:hypothetical protein